MASQANSHKDKVMMTIETVKYMLYLASLRGLCFCNAMHVDGEVSMECYVYVHVQNSSLMHAGLWHWYIIESTFNIGLKHRYAYGYTVNRLKSSAI